MYSERLRLDGKVTLVVGAGGGRMGTECSVALAEAGATVVGLDLSLEQMEETKERVSSANGTFHGLVADVMEVDSIRRAVEQTWRDLGPIQHLVYVVGGTQPGQWLTLDKYTVELFDRVIDFNLRSLLVTCREVVRPLIATATPGTIVNFASISGLHGAPLHGVYGAAKAGVVSLTQTMALEWGPRGIRVNAVAPGHTRTERVGVPTRDNDSSDAWNPLQRDVDLLEVAGAVLFLSSDLSSGMTGQTLKIDAGASARSPLSGMELEAVRARARVSD